MGENMAKCCNATLGDERLTGLECRAEALG
jgi:hypothetical protein